MTCSCNYVHLLFSCQVDEFYCITRYTDCKVCVLWFLRMLHSIDELLCTEYINIQVMCSLMEVTIQYVYQIFCTLFITMTERIWADCLCIRDSIKSKLVWKLSHRVQRCKKSALLCSVRWVCTRCQRLSCFSPEEFLLPYRILR